MFGRQWDGGMRHFMDWFFNRGRETEAMQLYKTLLDIQFKMIPATCNVLIEI